MQARFAGFGLLLLAICLVTALACDCGGKKDCECEGKADDGGHGGEHKPLLPLDVYDKTGFGLMGLMTAIAAGEHLTRAVGFQRPMICSRAGSSSRNPVCETEGALQYRCAKLRVLFLGVPLLMMRLTRRWWHRWRWSARPNSHPRHGVHHQIGDPTFIVHHPGVITPPSPFICCRTVPNNHRFV